ncbi:transposase-like protein [Arthrobacter sp. B3I9]|nr:hypothetical protein [Arthrobacter sp. B3I9]MDQ0850534.1 transposase-like protein [Arthrobacter sp. B3I9]
MEGIKRPGIWVEATKSAKFWAGVYAELANRGIQDVLADFGGGGSAHLGS